MADPRLARPSDPAFDAAVAALRQVQLRPEVLLEQVPAPSRLAPHALALSADVVQPDDDEIELANGRFVLLHDPAEPTPWEGAWRVVTFSKAQLDADVASDPVLAQMGWAWLGEALARHDADHRALAGTVTTVISERFGQLDGEPTTVDLEIRASWSPGGAPETIGAHLRAWADVLGELGGLAPLAEGVALLPGCWH